MSVQAREELVSRLIFQRDSQRTDLLSLDLTQTGLIALLLEVVNAGFEVEITAVRTDHHDDSGLGTYVHANGYAVDCWPLASHDAGDYLDASDDRFQTFLEEVSRSVYLYQIGLAGNADTNENRIAAGVTVFSDQGSDHVHIGVTNG